MTDIHAGKKAAQPLDPDGMNDTLRWAVALAASALAVGTIVKALRARRSGSRYVLGSWYGGTLFRNKAVNPNIMLGVGIAETIIILALASDIPAKLGLFHVHPQWSFKVPGGWQDLSGSAPSGNFDGLPSELVAQAKGCKCSAFAVDWLHHDEAGRFAVFFATVHEGTVTANSALVSEVYGKLMSNAPEGTQTFREKAFPTIAGQKVARFVVDLLRENAVSARMTVYVVPDRDQYSIISYTIPIGMLRLYERSVDDSIEATVASAKHDG